MLEKLFYKLGAVSARIGSMSAGIWGFNDRMIKEIKHGKTPQKALKSYLKKPSMVKGRRGLLKDERGSPVAWAVVIISIFGLLLVWGLLSPVIITLQTTMTNTMNSTSAGNTTQYITAVTVFDKIWAVWGWIPLILLAGLILWGFAYTLWHERGGY